MTPIPEITSMTPHHRIKSTFLRPGCAHSLALIAILLGCADRNQSDDLGASDVTGDPPVDPTTTSPGTSDTTTTTGDGDGDDDTTGDGDGDGDACDIFLGCMDVPVDCFGCDLWAQDCGEDFLKCIPQTTGGGVTGKYDAWLCAYTGASPPGAPCTLEPANEGQQCVPLRDSCDAGSMCITEDGLPGQGTCVEICTGSPENPACPVTGHTCQQLDTLSATLNICTPGCDPLVQGACPPGQQCQATIEGGALSGFACTPSTNESIGGEACACTNCCSEGYGCTAAANYGPDCAFDLCCTEYCSLGAVFPCAVESQVCVPLFDPPSLLAEHVGICMVP